MVTYKSKLKEYGIKKTTCNDGSVKYQVYARREGVTGWHPMDGTCKESLEEAKKDLEKLIAADSTFWNQRVFKEEWV